MLGWPGLFFSLPEFLFLLRLGSSTPRFLTRRPRAPQSAELEGTKSKIYASSALLSLLVQSDTERRAQSQSRLKGNALASFLLL